jgi:hypothetical protein
VGKFAPCAFLNVEIAAFAGDAVARSTSKSPSQPPMKPRFGFEVEIANSFFSGDQRSDLTESLEQPRIILMRVRGYLLRLHSIGALRDSFLRERLRDERSVHSSRFISGLSCKTAFNNEWWTVMAPL